MEQAYARLYFSFPHKNSTIKDVVEGEKTSFKLGYTEAREMRFLLVFCEH